MAERRTAAAQKAADDEAARQQRAAEQEELQRERAETWRAQQAMYAANLAQSGASQPNAAVVEDDDDDEWHIGWYQNQATGRSEVWYLDGDYRTKARNRAAQRAIIDSAKNSQP